MKIINIVGTAITDKPFDLKKLEKNIKGSETATMAQWLKFRLQNGNEYVAFYKSGKFLITGAKSVGEVYSIVKRVTSVLKKSGIYVKVKEVKIHNIVVSDTIENIGSLEKIIIEKDELLVSYEPEQFAGMLIHGKSCSFLLFSSGKVICAGNRTIEEAENNLIWLKNILR